MALPDNGGWLPSAVQCTLPHHENCLGAARRMCKNRLLHLDWLLNSPDFNLTEHFWENVRISTNHTLGFDPSRRWIVWGRKENLFEQISWRSWAVHGRRRPLSLESTVAMRVEVGACQLASTWMPEQQSFAWSQDDPCYPFPEAVVLMFRLISKNLHRISITQPTRTHLINQALSSKVLYIMSKLFIQ